MTDTLPTPSELLRSAAETIKTQGWTQGWYRDLRAGYDAECAVCAVGALNAVSYDLAPRPALAGVARGEELSWYAVDYTAYVNGGDETPFYPAKPLRDVYDIALRECERLVEERTDQEFSWLPGYNDAEGRTAEDIITLFLEAADNLETR